jgi:predicted MPP superfamily phosphohydrolase
MSSEGKVLRIAVVSDLHAHDMSMDRTAGKKIPSWISQKPVIYPPRNNPLTDLKQFVIDHEIKADIVVCPGDIADQANDAALRYAWQDLHSFKSAVGAIDLIASVGNHDVHRSIPATPENPSASGVDYATISSTGLDSAGSSPLTTVRQLSPTFPVQDSQECNNYWSNHIAAYSSENIRIVTLNSCASHGYITSGTPEYERGRFTELAESALGSYLSNSESKAVNILVTHHHPQQITDLQFTDHSTMLRGDRLLSLLGSGKYGHWMIIHGHRHLPFFQLGPGDNDRPLVFSAGSVGVILDPFYYPSRPPNQFYILEFDLNEMASRSTGLLGRIHAWNWSLGLGWQTSGDSDHFPARSGFGNRTPIDVLVSSIRRQFESRSTKVLTEADLAEGLPDFRYLLPSERSKFLELIAHQGIAVATHPRDKSQLFLDVRPGTGASEKDPPL